MKQVHRLAGHLHTATGVMTEGGNAIDVGIVCQSFFGEVICDGVTAEHLTGQIGALDEVSEVVLIASKNDVDY